MTELAEQLEGDGEAFVTIFQLPTASTDSGDSSAKLVAYIPLARTGSEKLHNLPTVAQRVDLRRRKQVAEEPLKIALIEGLQHLHKVTG